MVDPLLEVTPTMALAETFTFNYCKYWMSPLFQILHALSYSTQINFDLPSFTRYTAQYVACCCLRNHSFIPLPKLNTTKKLN